MELPYQTQARSDEKLKLKLSAHALPEYARASQGHRLEDSESMTDVEGIRLGVGHSGIVGYQIFRDPLTGEVYKSKKG